MSRIRWYASGGKRYYVIGVEGFRINPRVTGGASGHPPGTSYAVLDRDWMHREMASFEVGPGWPTGRCRERAEAKAAELNELEDAEAA